MIMFRRADHNPNKVAICWNVHVLVMVSSSVSVDKALCRYDWLREGHIPNICANLQQASKKLGTFSSNCIAPSLHNQITLTLFMDLFLFLKYYLSRVIIVVLVHSIKSYEREHPMLVGWRWSILCCIDMFNGNPTVTLPDGLD